MTLDPRSLPHDLDILEQVEKSTLRMVTQGLFIFRKQVNQQDEHPLSLDE